MRDDVLAGLTLIAGAWRPLAAAWHLAVAALLFLMIRRRLSQRAVALALAMPLLSVATLAWWSGNPFNTTVFLLLALTLAGHAAALPSSPIVVGDRPDLMLGAALTGVAWTYPHFVTGAAWSHYLYEAPLGLLPCPTLLLLAGLSLVTGSFQSRRWATVVAATALVYGMIGVLVLGVSIDATLMVAAIALGLHALRARQRPLTRGSST